MSPFRRYRTHGWADRRIANERPQWHNELGYDTFVSQTLGLCNMNECRSVNYQKTSNVGKLGFYRESTTFIQPPSHRLTKWPSVPPNISPPICDPPKTQRICTNLTSHPFKGSGVRTPGPPCLTTPLDACTHARTVQAENRMPPVAIKAEVQQLKNFFALRQRNNVTNVDSVDINNWVCQL